MKLRLNISSSELLNQYTVPYELDGHKTPGIKLKPVDGGSACQFMDDEGCGIYEDRPTACRYYPLGLLSMRKKDAEGNERVKTRAIELKEAAEMQADLAAKEAQKK